MKTGPDSPLGRLTWWGFVALFAAGHLGTCYRGEIAFGLLFIPLAFAWLIVCVRMFRGTIRPGGLLRMSRGTVAGFLAVIVAGLPSLWWHPTLPGTPVETRQHCMLWYQPEGSRPLNNSFKGPCGTFHTPLYVRPHVVSLGIYTVRFASDGYLETMTLEYDLQHPPEGTQAQVVCHADKTEPWIAGGDGFTIRADCGTFHTHDPAFRPTAGEYIVLVARGDELLDLAALV